MSHSSTNTILHQRRISSLSWSRQRGNLSTTQDSFRIFVTSSCGCSIPSWSKEATTSGPSLIRERSEQIMHSCMKSGLNAVSCGIGEFQEVPCNVYCAELLDPPAAKKQTRCIDWEYIAKRNPSSDSKHHTKPSKAGRRTPRPRHNEEFSAIGPRPQEAQQVYKRCAIPVSRGMGRDSTSFRKSPRNLEED
jgi:hypothetical protein